MSKEKIEDAKALKELMLSLKNDEVIKIKSILSKKLKISEIPLNKVYIAGGSLLFGKKVKDVDLYCVDKKTQKELSKTLSLICDEDFSPIQTDFALTVKIKNIEVQLITKYHGFPQDVVKKFDFKQNSRYFLFSDDKINSDLADNNNELVLNDKIFTPETLITRLHKMLAKGFTIEKKEMVKLLNKNLKAVRDSKKSKYDKKDFNFSSYGSKY